MFKGRARAAPGWGVAEGCLSMAAGHEERKKLKKPWVHTQLIPTAMPGMLTLTPHNPSKAKGNYYPYFIGTGNYTLVSCKTRTWTHIWFSKVSVLLIPHHQVGFPHYGGKAANQAFCFPSLRQGFSSFNGDFTSVKGPGEPWVTRAFRCNSNPMNKPIQVAFLTSKYNGRLFFFPSLMRCL